VTEISTGLSLIVIFTVLLVTVVAFLTSKWAELRTSSAPPVGTLANTSTSKPTPPTANKYSPSSARKKTRSNNSPEKYRARIREQEKLMTLLKQAHSVTIAAHPGEHW
jgi:tellurite resistance protein TerC